MMMITCWIGVEFFFFGVSAAQAVGAKLPSPAASATTAEPAVIIKHRMKCALPMPGKLLK